MSSKTPGRRRRKKKSGEKKVKKGSNSGSKLKKTLSSPSKKARITKTVNKSNTVQVAVRVRPLNKKELKNGDELCIQMEGKQTVLLDPRNKFREERRFTFDYSFWSIKGHDGKYCATNRDIYNSLGKQVIKNTFDGYNSCIFAYGQTGSGKSYSQFGEKKSPGIIPLLCHDLFQMIEMRKSQPSSNKSSTGVKTIFRVEVSMMEIYNEKIRDLLSGKKKILQLREDVKKGPFVKNLKIHQVKDFSMLNRLLNEGSQKRTIGQTSMNNTSSRAHTIFQINLTQIFDWASIQKNTNSKTSSPGSKKRNLSSRRSGGKKSPAKKKKTGKKNMRLSKINLIDLAGSENQKKAKTSGMRQKEGSAINTSLSMLGKVIHALASKSGSKKKVFVPYRDSKLTFLLKESLGGNSKTIMLATISPSDSNFQETLSTLKYADQAKRIKNQAIVNEDNQSKLINELRAQIKKLLSQLNSLGPGEDDKNNKNKNIKNKKVLVNNFFDTSSPKIDDRKKIQDQLAEFRKLQEQLTKSEDERNRDTEDFLKEREEWAQRRGISGSFDRKKVAHLVNLNEDPSLSENLIYFLPPKRKVTRIGTNKKKNDIFIIFSEQEEEEEENEGEEEEEEDNNNNNKLFINPNKNTICGEHCIIQKYEVKKKKDDKNKKNKKNVKEEQVFDYVVKPVSEKCVVFINTMKIKKETWLRSGDRLILGKRREKIFKFINPLDLRKPKNSQDKILDWDELRKELELEMNEDMLELERQKEEEYQKIKNKRQKENEEVQRLRNITKGILMDKNLDSLLLSQKNDPQLSPNAQKAEDIRHEIEKFRVEMSREKREKVQLESEMDYLQEQQQILKDDIIMSKLKLEIAMEEKKQLQRKFEDEKKDLENRVSKLSNFLRRKQKEISKIEKLRRQEKKNLMEEVQIKNLKFLKKERKLMDEIEKKKKLEEMNRLIELENMRWKQRFEELKRMLINKSEEFNVQLHRKQERINEQEEIGFRQIDKLQQQLSVDCIKIEDEQQQFDQKIRELQQSGGLDQEEKKKQEMVINQKLQEMDKNQIEINHLNNQLENLNVVGDLGSYVQMMEFLYNNILNLKQKNEELERSNAEKFKEIDRLSRNPNF